MRKSWMISCVSLMLLLASCTASQEERVVETVNSFYTNVYTAQFEEAKKYSSPESRSVILFLENTYQSDSTLIKMMNELKIDVKVSEVSINKDDEATATASVSGLPVFAGEFGSDFEIAKEPAIFKVKLIKIDDYWYVIADLYSLL